MIKQDTVECFLIWAEMLEGTRTVHMVVGSQEEADAMVHRAMDPRPASCGCCEDPSPGWILGIRKMWVEARRFSIVDTERRI